MYTIYKSCKLFINCTCLFYKLLRNLWTIFKFLTIIHHSSQLTRVTAPVSIIIYEYIFWYFHTSFMEPLFTGVTLCHFLTFYLRQAIGTKTSINLSFGTSSLPFIEWNGVKHSFDRHLRRWPHLALIIAYASRFCSQTKKDPERMLLRTMCSLNHPSEISSCVGWS